VAALEPQEPLFAVYGMAAVDAYNALHAALAAHPEEEKKEPPYFVCPKHGDWASAVTECPLCKHEPNRGMDSGPDSLRVREWHRLALNRIYVRFQRDMTDADLAAMPKALLTAMDYVNGAPRNQSSQELSRAEIARDNAEAAIQWAKDRLHPYVLREAGPQPVPMERIAGLVAEELDRRAREVVRQQEQNKALVAQVMHYRGLLVEALPYVERSGNWSSSISLAERIGRVTKNPLGVINAKSSESCVVCLGRGWNPQSPDDIIGAGCTKCDGTGKSKSEIGEISK
jgi:hypothetical protein